MFLIEIYFLNSQDYLSTLESKIEKNEKEITIKHQQIEDENNKTINLKNDIDIKQKLILHKQKVVREKELQLKVYYFMYRKKIIYSILFIIFTCPSK